MRATSRKIFAVVGVYILTMVFSYLLGSIPSGYLAGRIRGVDIRTAGSGNIGATNVVRVLGRTAGIIVLLADALKRFVAVQWGGALGLMLFHVSANASQIENLQLTAGVCAILGHMYTCWLKFKGGKGIATSAGVA